MIGTRIPVFPRSRVGIVLVEAETTSGEATTPEATTPKNSRRFMAARSVAQLDRGLKQKWRRERRVGSRECTEIDLSRRGAMKRSLRPNRDYPEAFAVANWRGINPAEPVD
jgi:hypothetical protein